MIMITVESLLAPIEDLMARAKDSKVNIVWTPIDNAESYNIYRSTAGGPFELIAAGYVTDYAAYADFGLTNDLAYCYEVTWLDGFGNESDSSNTACATPISRRTRRS